MALYAIKARMLDRDGDLVALQGFETNGKLPARVGEDRLFSIPEVLGMIEDGDIFDLMCTVAEGRISGGALESDGAGWIREKQPTQRCLITDLLVL
ncbi:hypothetical protein ACIF8Z_10325 [Pseudomonas promysalinigenes]|uniref:hypothetical protein n=1 Tax=Pseudomonas promysalinigenes TaxID=485898 RepID=UPI0037C9CF96